MRVLFFAPHPDDMEFFSGGIVADHVRRGDEVCEVIVSHGERRVHPDSRFRQRRHEALAAAAVLGVQRVFLCNFPAHNIPFNRSFCSTIRAILRRIRPDAVYLPSPRHRIDFWIPDHQRLGAVLLSLLRRWGIADLRLYGTVRPTYLVDVTRFMPLVQRAMRLHDSQQSILRTWGFLRSFFTWLWGKRIGVRFAEGFETGGCSGGEFSGSRV